VDRLERCSNSREQEGMMYFLIMSLATWRLSSLLAAESGPAGVFNSIRELAKSISHNLYEGMTCIWCNSIWIAFVLATLRLLAGDVILAIALPFALSACAIVLEAIVDLSKVREQEAEAWGIQGKELFD